MLANILFSSNWNTRTIGASGAIYGLLLAFGYLYPDREILFSFLFPMKAKYFVMIIGAIAFLSSFGGSGGGVSHIAHLGGMVIGFLYLRSQQPYTSAGIRARGLRGYIATAVQGVENAARETQVRSLHEEP